MTKLLRALFAVLTLINAPMACAALLHFDFHYSIDFCDNSNGACDAFGLTANTTGVKGSTTFDSSLIDASGVATLTPSNSSFSLLFGNVVLDAADDIGGFGGPGIRVVGSEFGGLFFDAELTDSSISPSATYLLSFSPDFGAVPAFQLTASGAVTDLVAAGTLAVPEPAMPALVFTALGLLLLIRRCCS
jgi:hypothetical protein